MIDAYKKMVDQRAKRIPLQHILGTAAMGDIDIEVGPGVFVPRPETELLLGWALAFLGSCDQHPPVVLDLCTGSGALALAIANARPDAVVHAVELEPRALAWARRNADAREQAGDAPIRLYQGDVTDRTLLAGLEGGVDLIVSNPPYIPEGVELEPEVADHDPHSALFAGPDGLSVIKPMISNVARWLRIGGAVGIEHDDTNGCRRGGTVRVPPGVRRGRGAPGPRRQAALRGRPARRHGYRGAACRGRRRGLKEWAGEYRLRLWPSRFTLRRNECGQECAEGRAAGRAPHGHAVRNRRGRIRQRGCRRPPAGQGSRTRHAGSRARRLVEHDRRPGVQRPPADARPDPGVLARRAESRCGTSAFAGVGPRRHPGDGHAAHAAAPGRPRTAA